MWGSKEEEANCWAGVGWHDSLFEKIRAFSYKDQYRYE
jgi:hypothetical protein